jgi:putative two-component system response regulator
MEQENQKPLIMIVDDESAIRNNLSRILSRRYQTIESDCGEAAIKYLEETDQNRPDCLILDIMMPGIDGIETAHKIREMHPYEKIPIIFITALNGTGQKFDAFKSGGVDYITKPFDVCEVQLRVDTHVELKRSRDNLDSLVNEKTKRIQDLTLSLVTALEHANLYNDSDTGDHIKRVSKYSTIIARAYGCDNEFIKNIELYASLHDIGKVGIPDAILKKTGRYEPEEYEEMKKHVVIGGRMLDSVELDPMARNIVVYHHEKWDGSGYAAGLKGEEIPLEARIVAIADVFDALTTKRVYKPAFTLEKSRQIIQEESSTHFDPNIVSVFISEFKAITSVYTELATGSQPGG